MGRGGGGGRDTYACNGARAVGDSNPAGGRGGIADVVDGNGGRLGAVGGENVDDDSGHVVAGVATWGRLGCPGYSWLSSDSRWGRADSNDTAGGATILTAAVTAIATLTTAVTTVAAAVTAAAAAVTIVAAAATSSAATARGQAENQVADIRLSRLNRYVQARTCQNYFPLSPSPVSGAEEVFHRSFG